MEDFEENEDIFDRAVERLEGKPSLKKKKKLHKSDDGLINKNYSNLNSKIEDLTDYAHNSFDSLNKEMFELKKLLRELAENKANIASNIDNDIENLENASYPSSHKIHKKKWNFSNIKTTFVYCMGIIVLCIISSYISSYFVVNNYPQHVSLNNPNNVVVHDSKVSVWNSKKMDLKDGRDIASKHN